MGDSPTGSAAPATGRRAAPTADMAVSTLGLMTAAAIVTSLRGLPMMAKEELTMFAYIAFSTFLFLVPAGLVAAELGGAFGRRAGGLYVWVGEAFGRPVGFATIFLAWVQNIIWYPTGLTFAATAAAYTVGKGDAANNHVYIGCFIIVAFWTCTAVALISNHFAGKVTKYGFVAGTVVPGLVLIALFLAWVISGHSPGWDHATAPAVTVESHGHDHPRWFPYISGLSGLSFLAGILLNFAGVESQGPHAMELKDPKRGYPAAIAVAATVAFGIFTLGALAVAGILPYQGIDITTGVFDALQRSLSTLLDVGWPVYVLAGLICYGALAGVLAWITGPSRGLLATARDGLLPPFMQKTNKRGVQRNILFVQGIVVSAFACLYLAMDNVETVFFLISAMAVSLYLIVYMLMYAAAIRLRRTQPSLPRAFRVPGGDLGMWAVAGTGFAAVAFAFVLAFVPPAQLTVGSPALYVTMVVLGAVIVPAIPFVLERFKKPGWQPSGGTDGTDTTTTR
ncbi:amino acid permease [Kitasatospora sp. NPDC056327]|uniref:amino acid permease n=1 Tax=Kitasatospora sp. NPDC056327 TaxID=3345785 RepID=UPI0035DE35B5